MIQEENTEKEPKQETVLFDSGVGQDSLNRFDRPKGKRPFKKNKNKKHYNGSSKKV